MRREVRNILYYNVTLQIVNIESGEIAWTDEKEIRRSRQKGVVSVRVNFLQEIRRENNAW